MAKEKNARELAQRCLRQQENAIALAKYWGEMAEWYGKQAGSSDEETDLDEGTNPKPPPPPPPPGFNDDDD